MALHAAVTAAHERGEASGLGEVYQEMGYLLGGESWLQPDASVTHAGQVEGEYFEGAPGIAVEVISPSNRADQIRQKAQLYFEFGAREVWRVHEPTRQIVVDIPGGSRVFGENDSVTTSLLPVLNCRSVQSCHARQIDLHPPSFLC